MGCPPPPAKTCPGCVPNCGSHNATHGFAGYWPVIPRALDYISADTYLPGAQEPPWVRSFYEGYIFPKLSSSQGVFVIPGLMAKIEPAASYAESLKISVNDSLFVEKLNGYAQWTAMESRLSGWMPFHYYNRLWAPTPDSGSWGAEVMPKTLRFLAEHKPTPL